MLQGAKLSFTIHSGDKRIEAAPTLVPKKGLSGIKPQQIHTRVMRKALTLLAEDQDNSARLVITLDDTPLLFISADEARQATYTLWRHIDAGNSIRNYLWTQSLQQDCLAAYKKASLPHIGMRPA